MNIFVLCTGRMGSTTFAKALEHIENFTAGHETLRRGKMRDNTRAYIDLPFPSNHIEVDNRLSWFLGPLEERYGDSAFYVHLLGNRERVANSYINRWENLGSNIIFCFAWGILPNKFEEARNLGTEGRYDIALAYYDAVNTNISSFLKTKPNQMTISLDNVVADFGDLWHRIGAQGDLKLALREFDTRHNSTESIKQWERARFSGIAVLDQVLPKDATVIMIDQGQWDVVGRLGDRRIFSFTERDGEYWGKPGDDQQAIEELERLRKKGATHLAFAYHTFYWAEHYPVFNAHLHSEHSVCFEDDFIKVFDLG